MIDRFSSVSLLLLMFRYLSLSLPVSAFLLIHELKAISDLAFTLFSAKSKCSKSSFKLSIMHETPCVLELSVRINVFGFRYFIEEPRDLPRSSPILKCLILISLSLPFRLIRPRGTGDMPILWHSLM